MTVAASRAASSLQGLVALSIGPHVANPLASALREPGQTAPLFHARTMNHVTLYASSVARSKVVLPAAHRPADSG